jgi:hypothetical protein
MTDLSDAIPLTWQADSTLAFLYMWEYNAPTPKESAMMHHTIWPEDRQVNDATVISWYEDAFANKQLAPEFPKYPDIDTMKHGLSDAGLVTFVDPEWDEAHPMDFEDGNYIDRDH